MGLSPPVQKTKTNCTKLNDPQTIFCLTKKKQNNSKLIPIFFKKADQINFSFVKNLLGETCDIVINHAYFSSLVEQDTWYSNSKTAVITKTCT